jgi:hypothetical protein
MAVTPTMNLLNIPVLRHWWEQIEGERWNGRTQSAVSMSPDQRQRQVLEELAARMASPADVSRESTSHRRHARSSDPSKVRVAN